MLIGKLFICKEKRITLVDGQYYQDDVLMDSEQLSDFALCLNSPWSFRSKKYLVEVNHIDGKQILVENEKWKCIYSVVSCDVMAVEIYAYGDDEQSAFENCINLWKHLQKEFNPENESV